MKLPVLAFGALVFIGCDQAEGGDPSLVEQGGPEISDPLSGEFGQATPFFEFDAVDHYFAQIDENDVFSLLPKEEEWNGAIDELPDNLRLTWEIVHGDEPQGIPERMPLFIDKLKDIGYSRTVMDTTHIAALNDIFREKPEDPNVLSAACIPVYRDILLFKRNGEMVGIAKICFDCNKHHIVGTDADTRNFGQHGDYGRLAKILS